MPDRILAIVSLDFDLGFKLTGIDTLSCESSHQAEEYLKKELAEQRYDIVLIDENFTTSFDTRFNKRIQESTKPLVMAIPLKKSFKKEIEAKDYFLKMVQSAIGYEIRIK